MHLNYNRKIIFSLSIWIILAFTLTMLVKAFWLEIYTVQGISMEDTFVPGDRLIIFKKTFNINNFILNKADSVSVNKNTLDLIETDKCSTNKFNKNEILTFYLPERKQFHYIKRCVGLPGDTLNLKENDFGCIDNNLDPVVLIKEKYSLWINDYDEFLNVVKRLNISELSFSNNYLNKLEIDLNRQQYSELRLMDCIDSINSIQDQTSNSFLNTIDLKSYNYLNASKDYFVIPYKGFTIQLNSENYFLYKDIIYNYENIYLIFKEGKVLYDQKIVSTYTFQNNYYFMLGDNRFYSDDSREFGLIPESNIWGEAKLILYSIDPLSKPFNNIRTKRIFKTFQ